MDKQQTEKRRSYREELYDRCHDWWTDYEETTSEKRLVEMDWPKLLADFVGAIALDSFKAGLSRGRASIDGTRQSGKVKV